MQGKCFTCGSPAFFSQHEEFYADVDDEFTDNPFKIFFAGHYIPIFKFQFNIYFVWHMKCIGMFVSYEFPYHFSGTKQV